MTKITTLSKAINNLSKLTNGGNVEKNTQYCFPKTKEPKKNPAFNLTKKTFWALFNEHSDGKYMIDQRNKETVFTVFKYFLRDPEFNSAGLIKNKVPSLDKGLLIYGDVGIGKTTLFEILHSIGRELITKYNFRGLWFNCIASGSFVEDYMTAATGKDSNFTIEHFHKGALYIDDLGFEKKAFNKTEILSELLFERNRKGSKTYCTTNLNPSAIGDRYGERIGDRLPEMFNIIKWSGESFRDLN